MEAFLIGLAAIIEPVRIFYQWRPQLSDIDDEMVLETALNGRADWIVTHNVGDFLPAASKFNLRVAKAADLIREMTK
jgi:predicted nucleic acid-binding protein